MSCHKMEYKGFTACIQEAERLRGDRVHALPPGRPLPVYAVDEFKKVPDTWMKGPGVFVVPVKPDKGLWFDWTACDINNTAIIPTVKGCNPITGLQTSGFHLDRYDDKCPKHNVPFKGDRFCDQCGYKWPFGNYVASPNILWLDGFKNSGDGSVRQFFFTADELRDVATHMIGKENTVPAFGFAFYRPKALRVPCYGRVRTINASSSGDSLVKYLNCSPSSGDNFVHQPGGICGSGSIYWTENKSFGTGTIGSSAGGMSLGATSLPENETFCYEPPKSLRKKQSVLRGGEIGAPMDLCSDSVVETAAGRQKLAALMIDPIRKRKDYEQEVSKEVSIGAGAKIAQDLIEDPYALDTWKDTPDAVMTIYFIFQEKFEEMKAEGMIDLTGKKEGMLEGLPIG